MFKVGDRVRVLRHRNFYGNDLGAVIGETVVLAGKTDQCGITEGFDMWVTECNWLIRSDDIEPVATASPVQLVPRVIPGTYGKVRVTEGGYVHCKSMKTAEEIRDTIATLEQIVEAM